MIDKAKDTMIVTCNHCDKQYQLLIHIADYAAWERGDGLIQDVLHYLTAGERELLISRTCDACWDKMFPSDDELFTLEDDE